MLDLEFHIMMQVNIMMQVRQSRNYCAPFSPATYHQHTYLPFEQLRVDVVNFHGQLLNGGFVNESGEYLGRMVDLDYGRLPQ
jgi:hypothetical protein